MAENTQAISLELTIILVLIYGIIGPIGILPAAVGVVALCLARNPIVLRFVIDEYEAYHGSKGNSHYAKLKSELSAAVRKDVSDQFAIEKAGLKATIAMTNDQMAIISRDLAIAENKVQKSEGVNGELRMSQLKLRQELDTLKKELAIVKEDFSKRPEASKISNGFFQLPAAVIGTKPAATPTFGGFGGFGGFSSNASNAKPAETLKDSSGTAAFSFSNIATANNASKTTKAELPAAPKPTPLPTLKITLPSQLQHLDPQRSGFTCIGRAIASHGGPCGSYSDEYLPSRKRDEAAAVLRTMRSDNPSSTVFEMPALRDLANNMLCIRHCRGVRYDQTDTIAQKWYDSLKTARLELEDRRKEQQKVPTVAPSVANLTQSTMPSTAAWTFGSRPMSPASSVTSLAASPPSSIFGADKESLAKKPFTGFGSGSGFSFGGPVSEAVKA